MSGGDPSRYRVIVDVHTAFREVVRQYPWVDTSGDRYWSIRNIGSIDKQESPKIHQSQSMRRKGDKPERATDQSLAAASRSRLSVIAN